MRPFFYANSAAPFLVNFTKVQIEIAALDREFEVGLVFGRYAFGLEQEWGVELLDVFPAVMDRLERIGLFEQLSHGGSWISIGAVGSEFHRQ